MIKHGIMPSILAVLSASPDLCLKQGIKNVYQYYVAAGYQTALQPCQIALFAMTCDPVIDLNVFAFLEHHYAASEALIRRVRYSHYEDKAILVPGSSTDLASIRTSIIRLDRALGAYFALLGVLYGLKGEIKEAMAAYRARMVYFARRNSLGDEHPSLTSKLIQVCLREFASELKFIFEEVGGRILTSSAQFVTRLADLPEQDERSTLMDAARTVHMEKAVKLM
jgi:hypothetical protein